MNKEAILFKTEEERAAAERVLDNVRAKQLAKEIDELISEVISYAADLDRILEANSLFKRYLDRISSLEKLELISLDNDLEDIDFRVKEEIVDLIKRINTRITIVQGNEELTKELKETYQFNEETMLEDINKAQLRVEDLIGE